MNDKQKEILLRWLNDAYTMEQSIIETLEKQLDHIQNNSSVREKVQEHIKLTKSQAERVKGRIKALGGDTSTLKSGMANSMGSMQGMIMGIPDDKQVKDGIADYSTEHFEIASYKALITAAEHLGDQDTVKICQEILKEEEEMAKWVDEQLPTLVKTYLDKSA